MGNNVFTPTEEQQFNQWFDQKYGVADESNMSHFMMLRTIRAVAEEAYLQGLRDS